MNRSIWLLVVTGLAIVSSVFNDYIALVWLSAICSLILLCLIYELLLRKEAYRFFLISSLACGAWVSSGVVQSGIASAAYGNIDFSSFFEGAVSMRIDVRDYSISMAYLFLFILCSNQLSRAPWMLKLERRLNIEILSKIRAVRPAVWTILLLLLSIALTGISWLGLFSIRGLGTQFFDQEKLPWWYPVITFLISLLPLMVSRVLIGIKGIFSPSLFVGIFGLFIGFYFAALEGRGRLVAYIASLLFCWILVANPALSIGRKLLLRSFLFLILASIFIPFIQSVFTFVNYIRMERGLYTNPTLFISAYFDFIGLPSQLQSAEIQVNENLMTRPLVLWPLAASMKMSWLGLNYGYLYFQDILNSLLNALPSVVYGNKGNLLLQENLLYKYFPFATIDTIDTADSPYLYSFASFWLFGVLIYPLVIALIYVLFIRILLFASRGGHWLLPAIFCVSTLASFAIFSYGEQSTTGLIRTFLVPAIFSALSVLLAVLFKKSRTLPVL
jgi:hypothetical protein